MRVKTLSLGVTVPDKFYELARNNEDMYLFSPYSVEKNMVNHITTLILQLCMMSWLPIPILQNQDYARELETEISKLQQNQVIHILSMLIQPIDTTQLMVNRHVQPLF